MSHSAFPVLGARLLWCSLQATGDFPGALCTAVLAQVSTRFWIVFLSLGHFPVARQWLLGTAEENLGQSDPHISCSHAFQPLLDPKSTSQIWMVRLLPESRHQNILCQPNAEQNKGVGINKPAKLEKSFVVLLCNFWAYTECFPPFGGESWVRVFL